MAKGSTPAWGEGVVCRCLTDRTTTAPSCHPPPMDFGSATRARLLTELPWKPIRGRPGRLVLDGRSERSSRSWPGRRPPRRRHEQDCPRPDRDCPAGGRRADLVRQAERRRLDTLATPEAFERKRRELELIQDCLMRQAAEPVSAVVLLVLLAVTAGAGVVAPDLRGAARRNEARLRCAGAEAGLTVAFLCGSLGRKHVHFSRSATVSLTRSMSGVPRFGSRIILLKLRKICHSFVGQTIGVGRRRWSRSSGAVGRP